MKYVWLVSSKPKNSVVEDPTILGVFKEQASASKFVNNLSNKDFFNVWITQLCIIDASEPVDEFGQYTSPLGQRLIK